MPDDDNLHRLEDIEVHENSLVDRAANKRKFLIVKQDGSMTGPEIVEKDGRLTTDGGAPAGGSVSLSSAHKESLLKAASTVLERLVDIVERVKSAEGAEGDVEFPQEVSNEIFAIADAIASIPEDVAGVKKGDGGNIDVAKNSHWMRTMAGLVDHVKSLGKAPSGAPNKGGPNVGSGVQPDRDVATDASFFAKIPGLEDLAKSLGDLGDLLKEQKTENEQLRGDLAKRSGELADLKKGIGLPASGSPNTSGSVAKNDDDVAWPSDMNNPDRGSRFD